MKLKLINLSLFDGEGGGAAPSDNGGVTPTTSVVYGKQNDDSAEDIPLAKEIKTDVKVTSNTLDDRKKAFNDLINGEYKDLYTEDFQEKFNKRFKEHKALEQKVASQGEIIEILQQRYNVSDLGDLKNSLEADESMWADAAFEAGMSVEQYKKFKDLERQNKQLLDQQNKASMDAKANAQVQQWVAEAEAMKQRFPKFDLQAEAQNEGFMKLLKSGVPMEHAYKVTHYDELLKDTVSATAAYTEKNIVDNIRAKGTRPSENGMSSQGAFTVKDDVSKLTKEDRKAIAKKVSQGETIRF